MVLGGIERVKHLKHQFTKANSDKDKIAILRDALNYGEAGEDFLSDIFSTEKGKIKWMAASLISATKNEIYKEILKEHYLTIDIITNQDGNN